MKKKKNTIIIIVSTILLILIIGCLVINAILSNKLIKVNYDKINTMIDNKESFVLCISRTTCTHCQSFKPKLKEVAEKYNIKIYYIDIDEEKEEIQKKFTDLISFDGSTPTTVFIKKGEEKTTANRIEGYVSKKKIIEKLKVNKVIN